MRRIGGASGDDGRDVAGEDAHDGTADVYHAETRVKVRMAGREGANEGEPHRVDRGQCEERFARISSCGAGDEQRGRENRTPCPMNATFMTAWSGESLARPCSEPRSVKPGR